MILTEYGRSTMHSSILDPKPHVTIEFLNSEMKRIGGRAHANWKHIQYYEDNAPVEAQRELEIEVRLRPQIVPRSNNPPPSPAYAHLRPPTNYNNSPSRNEHNSPRTPHAHRRSNSRTTPPDEDGWSTIPRQERRNIC